MSDLIERTRLAAQILRDIGGQSAMAATVDEAADALEAARADAERYRWLREGIDAHVGGGPAVVTGAQMNKSLDGGFLDAAIDAAMAAEGRE